MRNRPAGPRLARAAIAALAALAAVVGAGPVATRPAGAQAQPAGPLALAGQTPYVLAGGEFALRLRIDRSGLAPGAEVVVTVYNAVRTRSEFVLNLDDRIVGAPVTTRRIDLADVALDASGEIRVSLPVQAPGEPPDPARVDLGERDGVHPVRVVLRAASGDTVAGFTTHLVHLPEPHTSPRFGVALVLPFHSPPALAPGGTATVAVEALAPAAEALDTSRLIPYTLVPTPETVAALATTTSARGVAAVTSLRRVAADHMVVSGGFVPVHVPALVHGGLPSELAAQVEAGADTIVAALATRPDDHTWVAWDPLDAAAVEHLTRLGVDRLVVPEAALEPADLTITLTRPITLDAGGREVPAVMGDAGLTAAFTSRDGPVLGAHHLLADLAVLYLDAPGADRRGVVALPPRDWKPNRAFLDVLAAGLVQNPVVAPMTLDRLFGDVLPAVSARGAPLVRHLAPIPPGPRDGAPAIAAEVKAARDRLGSLAAIVPDQTALTDALGRQLLVAQSIELSDESRRRAYLRAAQNAITEYLSGIRLFQTRSITLTARKADIPMTFQNRTGLPVRVVVELESDKLDFPSGTARELELSRLNTIARFEVVARTSGAFPLDIVLRSPDGGIVIEQARLTVRSTAASGLSLAISASAALFLAVWWGRHIVRGRRARRLVRS